MYLSKKKIKGNVYTYLVHSVRLKNGAVKKIAKMLSENESKNLEYLKKKYHGFFAHKIREMQLMESRKVEVKDIVKKNGKKKQVKKAKTEKRIEKKAEEKRKTILQKKKIGRHLPIKETHAEKGIKQEFEEREQELEEIGEIHEEDDKEYLKERTETAVNKLKEEQEEDESEINAKKEFEVKEDSEFDFEEGFLEVYLLETQCSWLNAPKSGKLFL